MKRRPLLTPPNLRKDLTSVSTSAFALPILLLRTKPVQTQKAVFLMGQCFPDFLFLLFRRLLPEHLNDAVCVFVISINVTWNVVHSLVWLSVEIFCQPFPP